MGGLRRLEAFHGSAPLEWGLFSDPAKGELESLAVGRVDGGLTA